MNLIALAETGILPDWLIRIGIRHLLSRRLRSTGGEQSLAEFARQLRQSPLAIATAEANEQHYEVPAEFFQLVLGPRLKYSSCNFENIYVPDKSTHPVSLADAEEAMLRLTCDRAEVQDGMHLLELGCGWGSLTLWLAEQFPDSRITAVSNSASQRDFILQRARENGWEHVEVITADMVDFDTTEKFDRVISVEMFEHMRNYELLLRRVAGWLKPEGKAFVHVFCHRDHPYLFDTEGAANWMGRHFFTGGMMPSEDLFAQFDEDLAIERQWRVSGLHYERTCEAWLRNLDRHRAALLARFQQDMSPDEARVQLQRWRMFFMACAELFRYRGGHEWYVAHYLFQHQAEKEPVSRTSVSVG